MAASAPSVAVVIPCYNQEAFLAAAIESAIGQTMAAREIIVVDDGSTQDLSAVVGAYPQARLVRQENRGLAGARNRGIEAARSDKLIFLDSDDRLLPDAIAAGLKCFALNPDAAFVYGAHRVLDGAEACRTFRPVSTHRDFIRCNWVGMVATAMFDRAKLVEAGAFDESLGMCEDWDAYLRLSRSFPFASHDELVADYIRHGGNASNDLHRLWTWIEAVRAREWDRGLDADDQRAWREGKDVWLSFLGPDPKTIPVTVRAARRAARLVRKALGR